MSKVTPFDAAIVYSENTVSSALDKSATLPFPDGDNVTLNSVYSYFLEECKTQGLSAIFVSSADIIGAGLFRGYWQYSNQTWHKVCAQASSNQIFDKFSPINPTIAAHRRLLFGRPSIKPFNNPDLFTLFFDKLRTHRMLGDYTIPTVALTGHTASSVKSACNRLGKIMLNYPGSSDFTSDIVMKDRFGAGGWQVYKFKSNEQAQILEILLANPKVSFVLQPFADFDHGFSYGKKSSATDIRFLFLHGKIVQTFIRIAKNGDFRCNAHQGCSLHYLSLKDIPSQIIARANSVAKHLPQENSLYSLDFISTNSGNVYLLEGNIGPGISWSLTDKVDERKSKSLIRLIVASIKSRLVISPLPSSTLLSYPFRSLRYRCHVA